MRIDRKIIEQGLKTPADRVLIAIGVQGPELGPFAESGIETTSRGTIKIDRNMMTNLPGVFAAGDANRGQSIVVWAIGEGRDVARGIDIYLNRQNMNNAANGREWDSCPGLRCQIF